MPKGMPNGMPLVELCRIQRALVPMGPFPCLRLDPTSMEQVIGNFARFPS